MQIITHQKKNQVKVTKVMSRSGHVTLTQNFFHMQINTHLKKKLGQGHQGHVRVRSCDLDPKFFFHMQIITNQKKKKI